MKAYESSRNSELLVYHLSVHCLMAQVGHLNSRHHIGFLVSKKEKGLMNGISSPFKDIFWKLHMMFPSFGTSLYANTQFQKMLGYIVNFLWCQVP